jgi:hypothetical protein
LGIIIDDRLSFVDHMRCIRERALRMLGFVVRMGRTFDLNTLKTLYVAYVRSQLEYLPSVWSPYYAVHIASLESVQNRFLRFINWKKKIPLTDINYDDLRVELGLCRLADRREVADLICLWKIINGTLDCPDLLSRFGLHVPGAVTRQRILFDVDMERANYRRYSPIPRMARTGNKFGDVADIFGDDLAVVRSRIHGYFMASYQLTP